MRIKGVVTGTVVAAGAKTATLRFWRRVTRCVAAALWLCPE